MEDAPGFEVRDSPFDGPADVVDALVIVFFQLGYFSSWLGSVWGVESTADVAFEAYS